MRMPASCRSIALALTALGVPVLAQGSGSDNTNILQLILILVIVLLGIFILLLSRAICGVCRERSDVTAFQGNEQKQEEAKRTWKIDYFDLEIGEQVGSGVTGKVYKARFGTTDVAMKQV